jgi:two-component system response regulator NreC
MSHVSEIPPARPKIRCLLADRHALIRLGMRRLLEDETDIEIVDEAGTSNETLQKIATHQPDLVLVDTAMPGLGPLEALRLIQLTSPRTKLVFLTGHQDHDSALLGLQAGAMGYLHRDTSASNLIQAVRDVARGIRYVSPQVLHREKKDFRGFPVPAPPRAPHVELTPREREVVKLLAEGNSVRKIAELLGLSAKTVDAHKFNLMRKLDIHNKAQLVTYAIQNRILELSAGR